MEAKNTQTTEINNNGKQTNAFKQKETNESMQQ